MALPDPAAPFTQGQRYGATDRRADVPLDRKGSAPGLLPDPRWDGPRWAVVPDTREPFLPRGWAWAAVVVIGGAVLLCGALVSSW